jgi:hypothetical protein
MDVNLRSTLEQDIVSKADKAILTIDPDDLSWLFNEEMEAFLDAWRFLVNYYGSSNETLMSVEVVREYVHFMRLLRNIQTSAREVSSDKEISVEEKKRATHIMNLLEYFIDEIIKEVERTVNNPKKNLPSQ